MGALRLFVSVVRALHQNPRRAVLDSLDEIAAEYERFAYIGSRKTLSKLVREQADVLQSRLVSVSDVALNRLTDTNPELAHTLKAIKKKEIARKLDMASEWFRRNWEKDSGIFPDFLLALDDSPAFANGALIELKDSKSDIISSFNSTIPTRLKSLQDVQRITGSNLVVHAARLFDFPLSANPDYLSRQRTCLYLIRTRSGDKKNVRISLVEGSFFETLPKNQLLEEVWEQILEASGVPEPERAAIVKWLGRLEQSEIAQSRKVDRASIKPRLRIMSEVHSDANLHRYKAIPARTVNLVMKREPNYDERWLQGEFLREGISDTRVAKEGGETSVVLTSGGVRLQLRYLVILHKRNGEHIVLQYELS